MSQSSLSSVVSTLVRASIGSSTSTVSDEDLDRHVAELILKEAKRKAERYGKDGIRAYLPNLSEGTVPRTNKRFLTSIIRSTDDHNRTIIRAQALAAQEVKREREEIERRERRARAEEAVAAERLRRLMGSGRRGESDSWDKRRDEGRKRRNRSWEGRSDHGSGGEYKREHRDKRRRQHHHSPPRGREGHREEKSRSRRHQGGSSSTTNRRRGRSRSASCSGSSDNQDLRRQRRHGGPDRHRFHRHRQESSRSGSRSRCSRSSSAVRTPQMDGSRPLNGNQGSPSPDGVRVDSGQPIHSGQCSLPDCGREAELRLRLKGKHKSEEGDFGSSRSQSATCTPPGEHRHRHPLSPKPCSSSSHTLMSLSRSRSPSVDSHSQLPSKMDKYFQESYDPRLDVAPLATPKVPPTGLIDNSEFEGWDAMLELIRIRREDKEEKKRLESLGLTKDKVNKDKKSSKRGVESGDVANRWGTEGVSIMDIEYKKKGSVREWDMGKAGF